MKVLVIREHKYDIGPFVVGRLGRETQDILQAVEERVFHPGPKYGANKGIGSDDVRKMHLSGWA